MPFLREFLRSLLEHLLKQPWAIVAVVGVIAILAFQMIRGDALICADGAIFAKHCSNTEFPSNAIVPFAQEKCPSGWQRYEDGSGRFIVGVGSHTEYDQYGDKVEELKLEETDGNRTHRLSLEEMPKHDHEYTFSDGYDSPEDTDRSPEEFGDKNIPNKKTSSAGGNSPHNNMPPYIALLLCKPDDS